MAFCGLRSHGEHYRPNGKGGRGRGLRGMGLLERAKTRKATLMWTWLLGLVIFIDDYLNSLTVGSCMAPITDRHNVSREYKISRLRRRFHRRPCLRADSHLHLGGLHGRTPGNQQPGSRGWGGSSILSRPSPTTFMAGSPSLSFPLVILGVIPIFWPP